MNNPFEERLKLLTSGDSSMWLPEKLVNVKYRDSHVYKPKNTVMKILIFHRKQFLEKLRYQNTVFTYHEYCEWIFWYCWSVSTILKVTVFEY